MMGKSPGLGTCQCQWCKNSQASGWPREGTQSFKAILPIRYKKLTAKGSDSGDCMLKKVGLSFSYLFLCNGLWTPPYSRNVRRHARSRIPHARAGVLVPSSTLLFERVHNGRMQGAEGGKQLALELQQHAQTGALR